MHCWRSPFLIFPFIAPETAGLPSLGVASPLGYETDSYVLLPPATVCAAGLTVSNLNFAGSDFVRGKLHINLTAQTGTCTSSGLVSVLLQSSPDAASTFPPDVAAKVPAAGSAPNTTSAASQPLFTAGTTPVVGKYS